MMDLLFGTIPPMEDILRYIQARGGIPASVFGNAAATALAYPLMLIEAVLMLCVLIMQNQLLMMIIGLFALLMVIVGRWGLFKKAGRSGILAVIPIVSDYTEYTIGWKGSAYWMRCLFSLLALIAPVGMTIRFFESDMSKTFAPAAGIAMGILCVCIVFWYGVVQNYKLSKAYGHSFFFALGLMFFRPLFLLILGLGSSQYQRGKKEEQAQGTDSDVWICVGCGTMNAPGAQVCAGCGFGRMEKR